MFISPLQLYLKIHFMSQTVCQPYFYSKLTNNLNCHDGFSLSQCILVKFGITSNSLINHASDQIFLLKYYPLDQVIAFWCFMWRWLEFIINRVNIWSIPKGKRREAVKRTNSKASTQQATWPASVNHYGYEVQCKIRKQKVPWPTHATHHTHGRGLPEKTLTYFILYKTMESFRSGIFGCCG